MTDLAEVSISSFSLISYIHDKINVHSASSPLHKHLFQVFPGSHGVHTKVTAGITVLRDSVLRATIFSIAD